MSRTDPLCGMSHMNESVWVKLSHCRAVWYDGHDICSYSYVWNDKFICVTRRFHRISNRLSLHVCSKGWFVCVPWLIHACDMTNSHVWCDSFICETWRFIGFQIVASCVCGQCTVSIVCHDSFVRVTCLHLYVWHDICEITLCNRTSGPQIVAACLFSARAHSHVCHDSFICVTWRTYTCDMTHIYVWHDAFMCVTWHIRMCDMTHSQVWHDSFICVTCLIRMCAMTHSYVWHD